LAKLGIVVEEADESVFWLELLVESNIVRPDAVQTLIFEANQLVAIFSAAQLTTKNNLRQ
jgi:hypothetical protein